MNEVFLPLLQRLGEIDPTPFFVLSLLPYLLFLRWASKLRSFPRLALRGFQLTLLFVAVTIAAATFAEIRYGEQLADVDLLHGAAESFLTVCNLLIAVGFLRQEGPAVGASDAPGEQVLRGRRGGGGRPEDGASTSAP